MEDGAVRLREVSVARDALQLASELAARMPVGADMVASEPAVGGTLRLGTEVRMGFDRPAATSGAADEHRGRAWRLGVEIDSLLTGLAQRFVDESREWGGCWRTFASTFVGCRGRFRRTGRIVGQADMDEKPDQHESHQLELVK